MRKISKLLTAFSGMLALTASMPAIAQSAAAPPPSDVVVEQSDVSPGIASEVITVEGRLKKLRNVIGDIADTQSGFMPRLEQDFCPVVWGFPEDYTVILEDLIRQNAAELGIENAKEDCTPNGFAIFIDDPQRLMKGLRSKMPRLFENYYPPELDRLINVERRTYNWKVSDTRGRFGEDISSGSVRFASATRVDSNIRKDILGAFTVFDIDDTPGLSLRQIADYLTINMLMDILPDAERQTAEGSILGLFASAIPENRPAAMSDFDKGMLRAFYGLKANNQTARRQRGLIAAAMKEEQ